MDRRAFVKGATGAFAGLGLRNKAMAATAPIQRQPNVIFILPDEWRAQALGCMGNPDVRTPHLDKLASEGTLFRNTLANTPLCCPARANLLTGTYTNRNGMVANDLRFRENLTTLGDLYAQAGYRTGYIGKWHLDGGPRLPGFVPPGPRRHGFQYWAANECNHNYFYGWFFRDQDIPIISTQYEPVYWTDFAIRFLQESQSDELQHKPFFLMLALGAPHDPYLAPEKYMKMYDPDKLKMEPNWVEGTSGGTRKDIAGYYASITAIDDQIGRLLSVLWQLGLEDNTIVLFSSDHGNMLGSQGRTMKMLPWEESIRVPGIMRLPGIVPAGHTSDALFSHVDFAPTLLSLCGLSIPASMQGTDLSSLVKGKTESGPSSAYFQNFGPYLASGVKQAWRAIRTEKYMYARHQSVPWLLYDLEKDPHEMNNLVADPSALHLAQNMDAQLLQWMKKVGDSWSYDWTAPVMDRSRLYEYRTFSTVPEYLAWAKLHPQLAPGIN